MAVNNLLKVVLIVCVTIGCTKNISTTIITPDKRIARIAIQIDNLQDCRTACNFLELEDQCYKDCEEFYLPF